jgi:hypothetical protein
MEEEKLLEELNKFTRRKLSPEEVYTFSVILCDNEVDRDNEKFTVKSLEKLSGLFVGKTGIFDHNAKGSNQTARIFSARLERNPERKTSDGEEYVCLKADAYMVRTSSNSDLIKEIDGGIKKEVSVSCLALKKTCSICGANVSKQPCRHIKGNVYGGKKCFYLLEDIADAYEWSFVAVPAQVGAGITKFFASTQNQQETEFAETEKKLLEEIKSEVIKLCFLAYPSSSNGLEKIVEKMSLDELCELKKSLVDCVCGELKPQISAVYKEDLSHFKLGGGKQIEP